LKVIMRTLVAILALLASIAFAPQQARASTPVSTSAAAKPSSQPQTQPPLSKTNPAAASANGSARTSLSFQVNDQKGLLLTCIAPELDTNPDTDVFNSCALAPGRTLDDVMHTFIGAIHFEQNEQLKERAQWMKELDEKSAPKPAQK
jgi:hypothetical protein